MTYTEEYNIIDMNFDVIKVVKNSAGHIKEISFSKSNGPVYKTFLKDRLTELRANKKDVELKIKRLEAELSELHDEANRIQNNMTELEHELLSV